MMDENGEVVWSSDYKPFGDADITVNNIGNNFRFLGQYYDQETELHYNYHRYYDPRTGKYLTPDPSHSLQPRQPRETEIPYLIPYFLNSPLEYNLYHYVKNNPINLIDPKGLVCGSGWTDRILRDKPFGCDFSACCREHDDCYGEKSCEKRDSRMECDFKFLLCMMASDEDPKCILPAILYFSAVRGFGWIAH